MAIPRNTVRDMQSLAAGINQKRTTEIGSVHQALLIRAVKLLKAVEPDTEQFYSPMLRTMVNSTIRPDKKGDYENGMGRHYYCHSAISGKDAKSIDGYYLNGIKHSSPSTRTMLEEDYTMALTMYQMFFRKRAASLLGRAVHMVADTCCIPHCTGMTYYSAGRSFHKAYEELAEAVYPEFLPEQESAELPEFFNEYDSFASAMNFISGETARSLSDIISNPEEGIKAQLLRTERVIAALLLRFYQDTTKTPEEAHYIANNSHIRLLHGSAPLSVKVTENGILLHGVNPCPQSALNVTRTTFYAAHRHDGLFTLSPAKDKKHRVLQVRGNSIKLSKFNPIHAEQLFRL